VLPGDGAQRPWCARREWFRSVNKKAAVTRALQEFIARREQARILSLFGTVEIDSAYDYKAERSRG
jgi:hypothetical protein